jgi:hypothetical protein
LLEHLGLEEEATAVQGAVAKDLAGRSSAQPRGTRDIGEALATAVG